MKNISDISIIQTRLYEADVIPFKKLLTATNLKNLMAPFAFTQITPIEDDSKNVVGILMKLGEFKTDERVYPIEMLVVEINKIVIKILGDTAIANKFYNQIAKLLSDIDPDGQMLKKSPLLIVPQTTCAVSFDFDYSDIFSKKFTSFIKKQATKACSSSIDNKAKVNITPHSLAFEITYQITDNRLQGSRARIESKVLRMEPRVGIPLKERHFYTASPTDSETHLKLFSELEKYFAKRK
ncbi:MAG TPA: hypothetical protein VI914_04895 [Thermodesulfobacteriota bacterium]|nr:hypothetical protein [Thermodesulfobacteriota bacterium]HZX35156.1 hypothetical protein [Thermodesulfobacteriota bacterium]